ncbi:MAG: dethiobiotin synthase [Chitinophagaceae bacterium]|nr:dethiobiotin synthase [Chitinophagaceae bacterium]
MANHFFVTGIGTGIGKTLIATILARALDADYWKPIQAGYEKETDSDWVRKRLHNTIIHPEVYKLKLAASPHISAREEGVHISVQQIAEKMPPKNRNLIIEGPGGIMVPLNDREFVTDLVKFLDIKVILVSRNYLGSINHSLLTSEICKQKNIPVTGWVFNDQYLSYEQEIVSWSGIPKIASVPFDEDLDLMFIDKQASLVRAQLAAFL